MKTFVVRPSNGSQLSHKVSDTYETNLRWLADFAIFIPEGTWVVIDTDDPTHVDVEQWEPAA